MRKLVVFAAFFSSLCISFLFSVALADNMNNDVFLSATEWKSYIDQYFVPEYDEYNSYARENGHGGDLLHIVGTISDYTVIKDRACLFIITQEDGNKWCVSYGLINTHKSLYSTLFEGLDGKKVDLYATYGGFSDVLNLPSLSILEDGGVIVEGSQKFIGAFGLKDNPQKWVMIRAKEVPFSISFNDTDAYLKCSGIVMGKSFSGPSVTLSIISLSENKYISNDIVIDDPNIKGINEVQYGDFVYLIYTLGDNENEYALNSIYIADSPKYTIDDYKASTMNGLTIVKECGEKFTINNFSYLVPKSWITVENDYGGYYHYGASKGSVDGGFIYSSCTKIDSDQSNVGKVIQNLQDIINGMFGGGEDIPITLLPQDNYLAATYYGELNDYYSNIWVTLDGEFAYILVYIDTSVDHQGQDTAFGFILDTVLIDSKQEINNTERTNSDPILTPSFTPIPTHTVTSNPKQKVHDNRGEVHAIPVGKETGKLSYEIIDYGVEWWNNSIGSKNTFAFIAIKNTDTRYIYLDSCNFEYEDNDGHFLDSESMVSSQPDVIAPGEVGYYYVGGFAGGSLGDGVKTSNGVNLVAQFSLKPSTKNIDMYEVFDDSLSYENTFGEKNPVVKGRIKNNTNEDDSLVYVVAVLKDIYGNVLWISGTNISDVFAGATVGFSNSIWSMSPYVKNGDIASYDIIAKPTHYQW